MFACKHGGYVDKIFNEKVNKSMTLILRCNLSHSIKTIKNNPMEKVVFYTVES